jgi:hypothetical protein
MDIKQRRAFNFLLTGNLCLEGEGIRFVSGAEQIESLKKVLKLLGMYIPDDIINVIDSYLTGYELYDKDHEEYIEAIKQITNNIKNEQKETLKKSIEYQKKTRYIKLTRQPKPT